PESPLCEIPRNAVFDLNTHLARPRRRLPRRRPRAVAPTLQRRVREAQEGRRGDDPPRFPEPGESIGETRIAERVMVHDHATPRRVENPYEPGDRSLDRVTPDLALEIGHGPGNIEKRRPLLDEVRRRDGGRRTLDVRGEHEALALGRVDDREHDD